MASGPRSSDDLSFRQCEALIARLDTYSRYLAKVLERMGRLGWKRSDPLYLDTANALKAIRVMRLNLERLALFQGAFNEDPPSLASEPEYVIDPSKRPWEAGYRTPKR